MDKFDAAKEKAKDLVQGATDAVSGDEPTNRAPTDQTQQGTGEAVSGTGNGTPDGQTAESQGQNGGGGTGTDLGTVVEVKGPVVDVRFPSEAIPALRKACRI